MPKKLQPIHPGEILFEEFLIPLKISQYRIAKDIDISARRINEIVHEKRAISADTALRLGKYFNTSPQFWLNMQSHYDLKIEAKNLSGILKQKIKMFQFVTQ